MHLPKILRITILMLALGVTAQAVLAQSEAELRDRAYNPAPPPNPAAVERGKKTFLSSCAFCHGNDATGRTGPNLLDVPVVLHDNNGNTLAPFLHKGIPAQGMPAFPALTRAQAADIAAFLHARERIAADRFAQQLPEIVTGNAQAGKAYFDGAGKCSTCHSPTGDLAHIAKTYPPAELMSRISYPGPSGRQAVPKDTTVSVRLPSGQTVTGQLVHLDEFSVELLAADGSHKIYPVDGADVQVKDPLQAHKELLMHYTDTDLRNLVAYLETLK